MTEKNNYLDRWATQQQVQDAVQLASFFHEFKIFLVDKNLFNYTHEEVKSLMVNYSYLINIKRKLHFNPVQFLEAVRNGDISCVNTTPNLTIFEICSDGAACLVSKNTKWCLKEKFHQYRRFGKLFLAYHNKRFIMLHAATHQCCTVDDNQLYHKDPFFIDVAANGALTHEFVAHRFIVGLNQNREVFDAFVLSDPHLIRYWRDPSDQLCREVVNLNPDVRIYFPKYWYNALQTYVYDFPALTEILPYQTIDHLYSYIKHVAPTWQLDGDGVYAPTHDDQTLHRIQGEIMLHVPNCVKIELERSDKFHTRLFNTHRRGIVINMDRRAIQHIDGCAMYQHIGTYVYLLFQ